MDKTLEVLINSLNKHPADWELRKHLINVHVEQGEVAAAVNLVRSAPNLPDSDEDLVAIVSFLGGHDPFAALGFAERAMMENPQRGASHFAKSVACACINQPEAAAQHRENALNLEPALAALLEPGAGEEAPMAEEAASAGEIGVAESVEEVGEFVAAPVEVSEAEPELAAAEEYEGSVVVEPHEEAVAEIAVAEENAEPDVAVEQGVGEVVPVVPLAPLAGFTSATELPPIQPLVNPGEIPDRPSLTIEEIEPAALSFTTSQQLELTRSHLLVATPGGDFVDADELHVEAVDGSEESEEGRLFVAPAGIAPEAARDSKTKAKISAILMTIAIHAVLFLLIGLVIVAAPRILPPEIVAATVPVAEVQQVSKKQVVKQSPPKQVSPPAASVSAITSLSAASAASIPNVDFDATDTSVDLGTSFGASMSFGAAGGDFGAGVPFTMKSRCSATERTAMLRKHGGSTKVAKAVKKSLDYLQKHQNEDGSWGDHHTAAMTAFALLAFLGHCETPDSPQYGDTVMKGIMFLVELGDKNDGLFAAIQDHHYPYEHGPATYALGETYALAKFGKKPLPGVREAFEKGVEIIIEGQGPDGGWKYSYSGHDIGDTSVTGWQYQALKAAKHTKLKISGLSEAIKKAEGFFATVRDPAQKSERDKAHRYQYNRLKSLKHGSDWQMTAICALGMQLLGDREKGEYEEEIDGAIQWLMDNLEATGMQAYASAQPYGWYYATQVMFQKGGETWNTWNKMFSDGVLDTQETDGSWPAGRVKAKSNLDKKIYTTCLNTLMLEVYFRYLPAAG
jgi:hypothetical protein